MANNPLFSISYGLYILTAKENEKDNGCIINTLMQQTGSPLTVSITVNKQNYTHDMIKRTKKFNVSILTTETPFEVFKHFGFQSGKNCEKFFKNENETRSENGLLYITGCTNGYLSATVTEEIDMSTHTIFIAQVTEKESLSDADSLTYDYYHKHIKPQPKKEPEAKGYRCKICGYVYEGEELPADFVCPWCKHSAEDFEKIV